MQGLEESAQNRYPMVWFGLLVTCFGAFGVFDPCCWVQTNPVTVLGELHLNFDGFFWVGCQTRSNLWVREDWASTCEIVSKN